jgi:hypothetical protein
MDLTRMEKPPASRMRGRGLDETHLAIHPYGEAVGVSEQNKKYGRPWESQDQLESLTNRVVRLPK